MGFKPRLQPGGPHATSIGSISSINSGLWFLAIDASAVGSWTGTEGWDSDNRDCPSDFGRALRVEDDKDNYIAVGAGIGVIVQAGGSGWSDIWRLDDGGIALIEHYVGDGYDEKDPAAAQQIAELVAQLPAVLEHKVGRVVVTSGCLALLLPYTTGKFDPPDIIRATRGPRAVTAREKGAGSGERALVPMKPGSYTIYSDELGSRTADGGYRNELGLFVGRVRVVPS